MATVKIKGVDETIEIGFVQAQEIKKIWEDRTKPNDVKIDLDGMNCTKGDIRWINLKTIAIPPKFNKATNVNLEYQKEHERIAKLSPEQKSKRLGMFKFLVYCITGKKEIPESILKKAEEIQLKFFQENPKNTLCNPSEFKSLFPDKIIQNGDTFTANGLKFLERCVSQDVYSTKFIK